MEAAAGSLFRVNVPELLKKFGLVTSKSGQATNSEASANRREVDTVMNLSREADFVPAKMRTGAVLVGPIGHYGSTFRLGLPGAEAWENVPHRVVKELLDSKRIKAVRASGGTQEEYCLT